MFRCFINVSIPLADHWCIYFSRVKILSHVTLFLSPWKGLLPGIWANQCLEPMHGVMKNMRSRLLIAKASTFDDALYSLKRNQKKHRELRRLTVFFTSWRLRSQTPELKHLKTKGTISFIKHCLFHLIRSCHEKKKWWFPSLEEFWEITTAPPSKLKGDGKSWWSLFLCGHTSSIFVLQITFSWVTQVLTRISSQNLKCHSGNSFSGAQPWGPVQCGLSRLPAPSPSTSGGCGHLPLSTGWRGRATDPRERQRHPRTCQRSEIQRLWNTILLGSLCYQPKQFDWYKWKSPIIGNLMTPV